MRIVCQTSGFLPDSIGGVETFAAALADALHRRGHEILVLTSCIVRQPPGRYSHNGIDVVRLKFNEAIGSNRLTESAKAQREMNDVLREFAPDILHLNDIHPSSFFFQRRSSSDSYARLLTLHAPIRATNGEGLLRRLAIEADAVVAVSNSVAEDATEVMPEIRGKLEIIPNALPFPEDGVVPPPGGRTIFLCFGRTVEDKGMDIAIEAMAILTRDGLDAKLIIAGDGPGRPSLEALVDERGLRGRVEFRGWVSASNIPKTISESSAVLVPSRWKEPFGLVALETAQMARPVIASRIGGLPEVVEDGKTGLLVTAKDPQALAAAMAKFVQTPDLAAQMGRCARARAEQIFDFERFVTAYERVYDTASAARRATDRPPATR
jgi:glycogen(starch) synthase